MDIKIDKNNPIPIGVQVKEQIKLLVNSGSYNEGDKLPSINQLASLLGVNKNTIVTVLKDLENEGYINSHRGKGVFISKKQSGKNIGNEFITKVDFLIKDACCKGITVSELINIISARFSSGLGMKDIKALFIISMGRQLIDNNLKKLSINIPGVEFKGLFLSPELDKDEVSKAYEWADLLIVPSIVYEHVGERLPKDKPIIKTVANLKPLAKLKKGIEKKSKVAVISVIHRGAQILSNMFVSSKLFRPRLVLGLDEIDKFKKELKEIDSIVVCESAKEAVERLRLKEKEVYYFSDYIDDDSILEIKRFIEKI